MDVSLVNLMSGCVSLVLITEKRLTALTSPTSRTIGVLKGRRDQRER